MNELVGKKILSVHVSEGEHRLRFETDAGPVEYEAYGDCCSETWFADATGLDALRGGTVARVEALEENSDPKDDRSRQEFDVVYGYALTTDLGRCTIAFRCSSNGYYGGWCCLASGPDPELEYREIAGDEWSA